MREIGRPVYALRPERCIGIGKAFGPVTLLWFATLIALGLPHVIGNPHVLLALNPL